MPRTPSFFRYSYIINANGSIHGNSRYLTIEGYYFSFSGQCKYYEVLVEAMQSYATEECNFDFRTMVPAETRVEAGKGIRFLREPEIWSVYFGEETGQEVERDDLPGFPFYMATIRVNDSEVGKIWLPEKIPSTVGLGLYIKDSISGFLQALVRRIIDVVFH